MRHIQWIYGEDPKGEGFAYAARHPQVRSEFNATKRHRPKLWELVYQQNPSEGPEGLTLV